MDNHTKDYTGFPVFAPSRPDQDVAAYYVEAENENLLQWLHAMKYPKSPKSLSNTDEQHSDTDQSAMDSSISMTTSRPAKDSADYRRQVLEPRGIKIIDEFFDPNATAKLPLVPTSSLAKALGQAFVTFDPAKLMKACQIAKAEYNGAQWTAEIYQIYFLLTNSDPDQGGVRRMVQHPFSWSGKAPNICLPPVVDFDRRSSGLSEYSKIWFIPTDQKSRLDTTCWPDHCYFVLPEPTEQPQLYQYTTLPGFRTGLSYDNYIISCPPYFIIENKASADFEQEAQQYLAFIGAFLLQERLLLRHLADKAQDNLEIHFDESLCVYVMTNCGRLSTIYKMIIRNEFPNLGDSKVKKAIQFDLVKLCSMNLTVKAHCEQLKVWVNYIHYWGKTVHMPAVMAEGFEASQSKYCINGGWKETLARKSFYYTTTGIAFETLEYDYLGSRALQVLPEVEVEDSMNSTAKKQPHKQSTSKIKPRKSTTLNLRSANKERQSRSTKSNIVRKTAPKANQKPRNSTTLNLRSANTERQSRSHLLATKK